MFESTKKREWMTMVSTPAFVFCGSGSLVAAVAVLVTVCKSLAEIPAVKFPIPITATPVVVVVGSALVTPPIVIVMPASFDLTLTLRFFGRAPASPLIVVAVAILILMAFVFVPAAIARVVPVYKNVSRLASTPTVALRKNRHRQHQESEHCQHANSR